MIGEVERELIGLALRRRRGLGRDRLDRRRRGFRGRGGTVGGLGGVLVDLLEHRILEQLLLDDFLKLEGRELQELDRLLQQRRHDDALALPE